MADGPAEDLELVQSVLRGDTSAFRHLVERYQNLVAALAWRYGLRREEVEDVVSEIFTKVYRNLHQYRPDHGFSTWLYRLAANHLVDHGRRRRPERGRVEMPRDVPDRAPGADEKVEARERALLVREALRDLDSRYREVISLVYVEALRVEEVARLLGVPEGTVKTRLMRGREALRRRLVRRHPEHFGGGR